VSGGALAFTVAESKRDIWSLPIDLDRGLSKGPPERITEGPARRSFPSLSANGRYIVFGSNQSGPTNVWIKDFSSGKESVVASSPLEQGYAVSNGNGSRVAYSVYEKDKRAVYVAAPGGVPEKLCEGCLRATAWSRDEKTLLMFGGDPYQVNILDIVSHRQTPLLKHPSYHLLYARFSPDNRWVSFTARIAPTRARILIAPIDGPKPVPESAWIAIADANIEDWADWSPDGRTLYFVSGKDGHNCLWAQRLQAASYQPIGEAFAVQHLHGRVYFWQRGLATGGGRIVMALAETTGNIWMMSRPAAH
jgi:Tol biopolymer transport system component